MCKLKCIVSHLVGDGEVERVAHGHGGCQRRGPARLGLLAQVAQQDVGAQRPAGGQQPGARVARRYVLDHRAVRQGSRGERVGILASLNESRAVVERVGMCVRR